MHDSGKGYRDPCEQTAVRQMKVQCHGLKRAFIMETGLDFSEACLNDEYRIVVSMHTIKSGVKTNVLRRNNSNVTASEMINYTK